MRRTALWLIVPTFLLGACAAPAAQPADARPVVVAAFAPLADVAGRIGGDLVDVVDLTPPGVEPHDLELSASQVAQIADASVVVRIPGFQPAVDDAVAQQASDRALDASAGLDLIPGDPHIWLDPANLATLGHAVATRLAAADPAHAAEFEANATTLDADMTALSSEYATALTQCASTDLVVSHEAFAYLARAFGLTQVGVSGLSPEAEPSPARMAEVAALVKRKGIDTIYFEPLADPKIAQTIADETGAKVAVLDPIENLAAGSHIEDVMRANLQTLTQGQQCR